MLYDRDDPGHERIVTLDIETTHYKAAKGETVSVGLYVHDRGEPADVGTYEPFHRSGPDDEAETITAALEHVDAVDADALVTYHGRDFDMDFLTDRLYRLGAENATPDLDTPETHIDLFEDRKAVCDRTGQKWPKLEECLAAYDLGVPTTVWDGQPVTNMRFGEELGPAYLDALAQGNGAAADLEPAIDHYLKTDLEANLAIYYADIGESYDPAHVGTRAEF